MKQLDMPGDNYCITLIRFKSFQDKRTSYPANLLDFEVMGSALCTTTHVACRLMLQSETFLVGANARTRPGFELAHQCPGNVSSPRIGHRYAAKLVVGLAKTYNVCMEHWPPRSKLLTKKQE